MRISDWSSDVCSSDLCQLEELASGEATPDMIGINHYLTSERFLDHRTELYPGHEIGGNGRDRYVDAEAVRVKRLNGRTGIRSEEHTSELQSLMRISYAVFCLKKKTDIQKLIAATTN